MNPNEPQRDFNQSNEPNTSGFDTPSESTTPNTSSTPPYTTEPIPQPQAPVLPSAPQPIEPSYEQPFPSQPAFPSQTDAPTPNPSRPPFAGENPGQTLGVISIVVSFFGLSIVGIVLGIISRSKSKAAGAPTVLGTIGMVLGIVTTVIATLFTLLIFIPAIMLISNAEIKEISSNDSSQISSPSSKDDAQILSTQASIVAKKAEAFKVQDGDYPKTRQDFAKYPESTLDEEIFLYTMFVTSNGISYFNCGPDAAQVLYYKSASTKELAITALGKASATESCVEINK